MRDEKKRYIAKSDQDTRVPDEKEVLDRAMEVLDPTNDAIQQKLLFDCFQSF
jgi:hypothetical protein